MRSWCVGKFKNVISPVALVASSIVFSYVALKLIFPYTLLFLPLKTHWYLDEGIQVLAQYSKKGVIPEQYIALVGDSYAAGKGDWFLSGDRDGQPAYHSAHLIHDVTGKDIITFGANGAGSLRGLVAEPISQFKFINSTSYFKINPPKSIIVYFYEGNDFNNNLNDIRLRYIEEYDEARIYDEDYFRKFIQEMVLYKDGIYIRSEDKDVFDNFFLESFVNNLFADFLKESKEKVRNNKQADKPYFMSGRVVKITSDKWPPGEFNKVLVDGDAVVIPDKLQSPALELTDDEIKLSVYVFKQSLLYLKNFFPESEVGVVYIPSPLSSYRIASQTINIQTYEKRNNVYAADIVSKRSEDLSALVEEVAKEENFSFIDARKFILASSSNEIIHGPLDWKHFNEKGYKALSEAVIELINNMDKIKEPKEPVVFLKN